MITSVYVCMSVCVMGISEWMCVCMFMYVHVCSFMFICVCKCV